MNTDGRASQTVLRIKKRANMKSFVQFGKHFLWLFLRSILVLLRNAIWKFTGVARHLQDIKSNAQAYQSSVHVRKIWFTFNMDLILLPASETWFITTHESFQDPEYVLKPCVTLFYIHKEEVAFVETDPTADVLNSDNGGFIRVAQSKLAKKFIVMPLRCFHKVANSLPDVEKKVIFVCNTTRCGSTLLPQVFEATGRGIAWSEPDALNPLSHFNGKISDDELDNIARSTIKMMCKPVDRPINAYVLKMQPPTMLAVPRLYRLYPQATHLFMYRDALPNIKSFNKISHLMPLVDVMLEAGRYSGKFTAFFMRMMGLSDDAFQEKLESRSHFSALLWCNGVKMYLDFRQQGIPIHAVKYEDVIEHTMPAFKEIFKLIKMPFDDSIISALQTAFSRDSQRSSPLNREAVSRVHPEVIDERIMKNINNVCKQFGLPPVTEPLVLPGTITHVS